MNPDKLATAIGFGMAAVQAASVDYAKLAAGDRTEIVRLALAFLFGAFGIITNKK